MHHAKYLNECTPRRGRPIKRHTPDRFAPMVNVRVMGDQVILLKQPPAVHEGTDDEAVTMKERNHD